MSQSLNALCYIVYVTCFYIISNIIAHLATF